MSYSSEPTRKRRASSIAEDRAVKTTKLGPSDEGPPLQVLSSTDVPPPTFLSTSFTYSYHFDADASLASVAEMPAAPLPSSYAGTQCSSRLPHSDTLYPFPTREPIDAMQQFVFSTHDPIPMESTPLLHPPDFIPSPSATSAGFSNRPWSIQCGTAWPDDCIPTPLSMAAPVADSSTLPYNTTLYRPTGSTHLQKLYGSPPLQVPDRLSHATTYEPTTQSGSLVFGRRLHAESPREEHDDRRHPDGEGVFASCEGRGSVAPHAEKKSSPQGPVTGKLRQSCSSLSNKGSSPAGHGNNIPQEHRADVERIFFEFVNSLCSNLDATDSKGEPIHQTLTAKKMQRLDDSSNFRPFKFRVMAFTNAFLEELARQGLPEEIIPAKHIRNFLWNEPHISRFNEGGKKSKSCGNHIWHIDAKKAEGGWSFRPFRRRLVGASPCVAYIGLRWTWTPRIWDPHASLMSMPVSYSSPTLPPWLTWNEGSLTGIPPPEAHNCEVKVEARFIREGKEELLTDTVYITILSLHTVDSAFMQTLQSSLIGGGQICSPPRKSNHSIGSGVLQLPDKRIVTTPRQPETIREPPGLVPIALVVGFQSQVVQVLTTAAQRVAIKAQSQIVASPNEVGPQLQALAKQQHVLTMAAQAVRSKMAGEISEDAIIAAVQQVVLQAAHQVIADRTIAVSSGVSPVSPVGAVPQITVKEVSVMTESAVAEAVHIVGPLSTEVDVFMMAWLLLLR